MTVPTFFLLLPPSRFFHLLQHGSSAFAQLNCQAPVVTHHHQVCTILDLYFSRKCCPHLLQFGPFLVGVMADKCQMQDQRVHVRVIRYFVRRIVINLNHHLPAFISKKVRVGAAFHFAYNRHSHVFHVPVGHSNG